jgi:hypothetical protein
MKGRGQDESGYALVWAVVTMIIAAIMIAGTLLAGQAYASRNLGEAVSNQAYLTARSAAEAIAAKIDGTTATCLTGETPDYNNPLLPADGASISITGSSFNFPAAMGTVDAASIARSGDQIIVSASASKGGETATVKISILHTMTPEDVEGEYTPVYLNGWVGLFAGTKLTFNTNTTSMHVHDGDIYAYAFAFGGSKTLTDLIYDNFYINASTALKNRLKGPTALQAYPAQEPVLTNTTNFSTATNINGGGTIDLSNNSAIYYKLSSNITNGTIKLGDDHDYYIQVPSGRSLTLKLSAATGTEPRVFIVNSGTVTVSSPSSVYVYIYGMSGSTININNGISMSGSIYGETVTLSGTFDLTDVDTNTSDPNGVPAYTTENHRWDNNKYLFE